MAENNQETTRVSRLTIGRLHNLGDYEHIRYEVTVEIAPGDNPAEVTKNLERILEDIQAKHGVMSHNLRTAREVLAKPEAELSSMEKEYLPQYQERVRKVEAAQSRRDAARAALATLNYTSIHTDHKEKWDDNDYY